MAFPKTTTEFRRVVDHESPHLNVPYLSVATDVLAYLGRHKVVTSEDTLASDTRIRDALRAVCAFMRFPAWRNGKRARLQYVLWEVHDSGVVPALVRLREDSSTRDAVSVGLVRACRALLDSVDAELQQIRTLSTGDAEKVARGVAFSFHSSAFINAQSLQCL